MRALVASVVSRSPHFVLNRPTGAARKAFVATTISSSTPSKAKKLTNIRTTAADEKLTLSPPRLFTLESALEFINNDELVEVTPKAIRLRKRSLDHNERKRTEKVLRTED